MAAKTVVVAAFSLSFAFGQGEKPVIEIVTDADGNVIERKGPSGETPGTRYVDLDPFITATREATAEFTQRLPDFLCEQLTTRSSDRVTAEVLYVDGRESYRNLKINGKAPKGNSPAATGTWSTGEYGTMAKDVFSAATAARFEHPRDDRINNGPARSYSYKVARANSHWRVDASGQVLYPAYEGTVWIEPAEHRVLRLEMIGREIPKDFPFDSVEMTVDYGVVKIGSGKYLLPTVAECLACRRGTNECTRNRTIFRNYRKFTAESTISTTDSNITFDEEKPER
ncbi:MAG: hypothetical protein U0Q16_10565 [Bryobacteraceae bacterium]